MRMLPLSWRAGIVGAVLLAGWGWNAAAAPVTTQFTVTGDVTAPATYNFSSLSALPPTTENVTYQSGGTTVNTSFTGPTLWSLLNTVGLVTPPPPVKNGMLLQYVVATGSDGYSALFSLAELNPNFGGSTPQVLVANLQGTPPAPPAPLGSTGFARAVAAKNNFGGRYVSNLDNLRVGTAQVQTSMGGGETSEFSLSGAVKTPGTYNLASLQALPATTENVTYLSGSTTVMTTFTGVSIWTLLTDAGIVTNPAIKNDILNYYLQATGSDGYSAIFSLGEFDPMFGGSLTRPDLIAYDEVGNPFLGSDGFARVVVPGDFRGGRYVSNLVSLEVTDAVPEPASIILLAAALLALTLVRSVRLAVGPETGSAVQPGCAHLSHRLYCPNGEAHLASRFRTRTGRRPWQDTAARGNS